MTLAYRRITIIGMLLLFGVLAAPHLFRIMKLGTSYTPFLLEGPAATDISAEETNAYLTLINRTSRDQSIADPYSIEYRYSPSPFWSEWLSAEVLGNVAKIIGVVQAMLLIKVFGPLLLIWLLVKISRQAGFPVGLSLLAGTSAVVLPKLYPLIPYRSLWTYIFNSQLEFQRLFHPLMSWIVVAIVIVMIQASFDIYSSLRRRLLTGMVLGSLFYTYVFAWTLIWVAICIVLITMIIKREYQHLRRLGIIIVIGMAVGLPYIVNGFIFSHSDIGQEFISRTTFPIRQRYYMQVLRYLLLGVAITIMNRSWFTNLKRRLILSILSASIILPDMMQIILGYNAEADHWIERFIYPLSTLLMILGIGQWIHLRFKSQSLIMVVLIVVALMMRLASSLVYEMARPITAFQLNNDRQALYAWMQENIHADTVIGGISFVEQIYLAAYTPYYPYLPRGDRSLTPAEEVFGRFIFISRILGANSEYFDRTLSIPPENIPLLEHIPPLDQNAFTPLFSVAYLLDRENGYVLHLAIRERAKQAIAFDAPQIGKLNYLLIGPTEKSLINPQLGDCCQSVYSNETYNLYRYNPGIQ